MSAQLLSQEGTQVRIEVTIDLSHSLRLCRKYFLVTNEVSRSHSVKR
ncbi:hypothetical protein [Phormidesmis priestleyi]|nr:hypothetical protein [Phormidesmis priestleyi]